MSTTVVVGLDGSSESAAAAHWAAREALRRGAVLDLVQVRMPPPYPAAATSRDGRADHEWSEEVAGTMEDELNATHPELTTARKFLTGRPSRTLAEVTSGSDLMVLGSRGLGTVHGFLVGSVALPTVAHAECPVVLVRRDRPASGEAVSEGGVVLGMELDRAPEEPLAFAFRSAARRGVTLHVLHCWEPPPGFGVRPIATPPNLEAELNEDRTRTLHDMLRPWQEKYPDVTVDACAVVGSPGPRLVGSARSASLLVVGRRTRRSPLGSHIGAVTHAAMHHAAAPVAVVPHS